MELYRHYVHVHLVVSLLFVSLISSSGVPNPSRPVQCNVRDYGALGNGSTLETSSIQSAINACHSRSNKLGSKSVVWVPPGSYLTGTLFLRSNMTLHIDRGAKILGSSRQMDYPPEKDRWYVILAEGVENVGITGGGEVNGQSSKFVVRYDPKKNIMTSWNVTGNCLGDECRPRLVGFLRSTKIRVWNIDLRQPAYWCLHLVNSNFIHIHDISILGDFDTPNNDGIDIDGSNNTVIERCRIDTGDDAICPKTTYGPLVNLTVRDCWVRTKSCGVKLGSATFFDFHHLRFSNLIIVDSHRGLGIQLRDAGSVYGVIFANIVVSTRYYDPSWWGRAEPIYVTVCPRDESTRVGSVHSIEFRNITGRSENGIFLAASGNGAVIHSVKLVDVDLKIERWTSYSGDGGMQDFRPGCQGLISHDKRSGMFVQRAHALSLQNVSFTWVTSSGGGEEAPIEFGSRTPEDSISLVNFANDFLAS
ncbi:hypothetical protein SELMODRAFT_437695 [Selaginella moellendorffii]|uniref:Pectate lyase superfamily protein domain-containing protein n=2 Tax=Selaginella moellendorffii TaxID=88036 RepID=D8QNX5_SELML|nr:hypothetical protein SELMODRAFT_437695 [Selaginella moellendorffii]